MASTTPSAKPPVKSQKPGRLYICTAQWFEKTTRYTRDFVIYALTKAEASQIVKNHIPEEIRESVSDNNNLSIMTRDYGTPKPWRTYFTSDIRISDKTDENMPSAIEMISISFSIMLGRVLDSVVLTDEQSDFKDPDFIQKTVHAWSKDYLYSSNITKEQFFQKKLDDLGITVDRTKQPAPPSEPKPAQASQPAPKQQTVSNESANEIIIKAHEQAAQILNSAHEKAFAIITEASTVQKRIYSDAQTYSNSLTTNTINNLQTKMESFDLAIRESSQKMDTAQDKALSILAALQQILDSEHDSDDIDMYMEPDEQAMSIIADQLDSSDMPADDTVDHNSNEDDDGDEEMSGDETADDETSDDTVPDESDYEPDLPEDNDPDNVPEEPPIESSIDDTPDEPPVEDGPSEDNPKEELHQTEDSEDIPDDNQEEPDMQDAPDTDDDTDASEEADDMPDGTSQDKSSNTQPAAPTEHFENYKPIYDFNDIDLDDLQNYLTDPNNRLILIIIDKDTNKRHVHNLAKYLEFGRKKTLIEKNTDPFDNPSWLWTVLCMSRTPEKHSALTAYLKLKHIPPDHFVLPNEEFWKTYKRP